MGAISKITDSVVIVGSVAVGFGAVKGLMGGIKMKSAGVIALSSVTLLIAVYAFKNALDKIND